MKNDEYSRYLRDIISESIDSGLTAKEIVDAFRDEIKELVDYHTERLSKSKALLDELSADNTVDFLTMDGDEDSLWDDVAASQYSNFDFSKSIEKLNFDVPNTLSSYNTDKFYS